MARFRRLLSLHDPVSRAREGLFLAEGVRFVARAVASHAPIRVLATCRKLLYNPIGRELAAELQRARAITHLELELDQFRELSILGEPQGIAVAVEQSWKELPRAFRVSRELWLGVESIRMPGNLGTVLRTAQAAGAKGLIVIGPADPFAPRSVRATMGSIFGLDMVRCEPAALRRWVEQTGARIVGADGATTRDYRTIDYRGPTVLMMGSERRGLSATQRDVCDVLVRIPMIAAVDSLNVTAAASVLLYEAHSQRNPLPSKPRRPGRRRR